MVTTRRYDPVYRESTQKLFSLSDDLFDYLDIDWTKPQVLRDRLRRIDRLIYLHGMYERNRRLIDNYRKRLLAALPQDEQPPYPPLHIDWTDPKENDGY